jgi:WD40 repeat protein
MTANHEALVRFSHADYRGTVDLALSVGWDQMPRVLMLLCGISMQQSGRAADVPSLRTHYRRRFGDEHSKLLLAVALDAAPIDRVLDQATTNEQRGALHFYRAVSLRASGRSMRDHLLEAALNPGDEASIARALVGVRHDSSDPQGLCLTAFRDALEHDDYSACWTYGLEAIDRGHTDALTSALTLVALQRDDYASVANSVGRRLIESSSEPWADLLVHLTLGHVTRDEIPSPRIEDDDRRAAVAYFAGTRLSVAGRAEEALDLFRESASIANDGPIAELAWLELARRDVTHAAGRQSRRVLQPWGHIRLFVSSTFRDMHAEREQLVAAVFPSLRRYCARRRLFLYDVDLRWGVAEEENSVTRSLNDIAASDIFICLLGERYGVTLPGQERSTTDEEIRYASTRVMPRLFFVRRTDVTSAVPESDAADYRSEGLASANMRDRMRAALRPGDPVISYGDGMRWDPDAIRAWDPSRRGCFVGLEGFSEAVRANLEAVIDEMVADASGHVFDGSVERTFDEQDWAMEAAVQEHLRSGVFTGRTEILESLRQFVDSDSNRDSELVGRIICLLGPSGSGKSALLAQAVRMLSAMDDVATLWHFIGATAESARPRSLLARLARKLGAMDDSIEKASVDLTSLKHLVESRMASASTVRRLVLIIDGLDQINPSYGHDLDWLPRAVHEQVRVIVSAIHDPDQGEPDPDREPVLASLRRMKFCDRELPVTDLSPDDRAHIVRHYLAPYGKSESSLSASARAALIGKAQCGLPLYLLLSLDELRTRGGNELHTRIHELVANLPDTVEAVFESTLERVAAQSAGMPGLARRVLTAICLNHARGGVSELELNALAVRERGASDGAYARIIALLRTHLVERLDEHGNGLIAFFHDRLLRAATHWLGLDEAGPHQVAAVAQARTLYAMVRGGGRGWDGPAESAGLMRRLPFELLYWLVTASQHARLAALLCNLSFVASICRRGQAPQLIDAFATALADWPGALSHSPIRDAPASPTWLSETTMALIASSEEVHADRGAGPLLTELRHSPQPTVPIVVIDRITGDLHTCDGHLWDVESMAITPDGRRAVSASSDGTIRVWNIASREHLRILERDAHTPLSIDVTDDGRFVLAVDKDGGLSCWSVGDGALIETTKSQINRIHLAADGRTAVAIRNDGCCVLDLVTGVLSDAMRGSYCAASAFAKIEPVVVTADRGVVALWDTRFRIRLGDLVDPDQAKGCEHTCVAITPDGRHVLAAGSDGNVRVWDARADRLLEVKHANHESIRAAAIAPDGHAYVTAGSEGRLQYTPIGKRQRGERIFDAGFEVTTVALVADGRTIVAAGKATGARRQRRLDLASTSSVTTSAVPAQDSSEPSSPRIAHGAFEKVQAVSRLLSTHVNQLLDVECDAIALAANAASDGFLLRRAQRLVRRRSDAWVSSFWWRKHPSASPLHAVLLTHDPSGRAWPGLLAASATGSCVATVVNRNREIQVWDVRSGSLRLTLRDLPSAMKVVALTPDGRLILAGAEDGSLRIWDARSGHFHVQVDAGPGAVVALDTTGDGALAASLSGEGRLSVWDLRNGHCIRQMDAHRRSSALALSIDGRIAVTTSGFGREHVVWDIDRRHALRRFYHDEQFMTIAALSEDGRTAISDSFKELWRWEVSTGILLARRVHDGHVDAVSRNSALALWSDHTSFHVEAADSGEIIRTVDKGEWTIGPAVLTNDGAIAITGGADRVNATTPKRAVLVWDLGVGARESATTRPVYALRGAARSTALDWSAFVSGESEITIGDRTGRRLRTYQIEDEGAGRTDVLCLAIAPDGRSVAAAGYGRTIHMWDAPTGRQLLRLGGGKPYDEWEHAEAITKLAFAPDGRRLYSASQDTTVLAWSVDERRPIRRLGKQIGAQRHEGHWAALQDLAIAPSGREAVTVGNDGLIHAWDLIAGVSRMCLSASFDGRRDTVNAVAYSLDGRFLVTASEGRTLEVWDSRDGTRLATHVTADEAWSLAPQDPRGRFICVSREHRAWIIAVRNLTFGPPLVTAGTIWLTSAAGDVASWREEPVPGFLCPYCYTRSPASPIVIDGIEAVARTASLPVDASPCLSLPLKAWDEPRLVTTCPSCGEALRMNPFLAR